VVLKPAQCGKEIRNTWKVLKYGTGEGRRRSLARSYEQWSFT